MTEQKRGCRGCILPGLIGAGVVVLGLAGAAWWLFTKAPVIPTTRIVGENTVGLVHAQADVDDPVISHLVTRASLALAEVADGGGEEYEFGPVVHQLAGSPGRMRMLIPPEITIAFEGGDTRDSVIAASLSRMPRLYLYMIDQLEDSWIGRTGSTIVASGSNTLMRQAESRLVNGPGTMRPELEATFNALPTDVDARGAVILNSELVDAFFADANERGAERLAFKKAIDLANKYGCHRLSFTIDAYASDEARGTFTMECDDEKGAKKMKRRLPYIAKAMIEYFIAPELEIDTRSRVEETNAVTDYQALGLEQAVENLVQRMAGQL